MPTGSVLSDVHCNGNGTQPAVHAPELVLPIVALEQSHKDEPQQDENASCRLQSYVEILMSTAQAKRVSAALRYLQCKKSALTLVPKDLLLRGTAEDFTISLCALGILFKKQM